VERRSTNEIVDRLKALGVTDEQITSFLDAARARREAETQRDHVLDVPQEDTVAALQRRVRNLEEAIAALIVKLYPPDSEQG
jgi:hypothetical protein